MPMDNDIIQKYYAIGIEHVEVKSIFFYLRQWSGLTAFRIPGYPVLLATKIH